MTQAVRASRSINWPAPLFALAFLAVFLAPPFTPGAFPPYPLLRWGDVIDLATPIVMLPAYWVVLSHRRPAVPPWEVVVFLVLGAIWIEGQAIHLAANSIGHQPATGTGRELTEFYDEKLGHLLWHGAALALAAFVVIRRLEHAAETAASHPRLVGLASAAVFGFALFLVTVEGATAILVAGGGLVVVALAARRGPAVMFRDPIVTLFGAGHALMLVLLGTWFVYWGGRLPEFSSLGLIR